MKIITFDISGLEITTIIDRIKYIGLRIRYVRLWEFNNDEKIFFIIFTKYMLRINSDLSITVTIHFKNRSEAKIDIISTGGKSGLLQFGHGSEKHNEKRVFSHIENICQDAGWSLKMKIK